ncbi:MAG: CRTAC1 family protein, partial [Planctomycetota bacterium]
NTGAAAGPRFEDVTADWGLDAVRFDVGVAVAYYDADGDPDLFVTGVGPCALYRNDGDKFTDVAEEAGVRGGNWTDADGKEHAAVWSAAAFLDYDGDGTLDLYACRYIRWSMDRDVFTTIDGKTKAYTIPDRYDGDSGRLYRGKGDGTFEDVTDAAGLRNDDAKALGVVAADLDDDGDIDLAIANDTQPNHLYVNNGDGTFSEQGLEAGVAYDNTGKARADMGIAAARVDDSGLPVIVTGTFSQESLSFYREQPRATSLTYIDQGGGAGVAGPTFPSLTFGVLFEDFDLDGRLDLAIANGHIEPTIQSVMKDIPYEQAPQVFRNLGGGEFREVSDDAGPGFAAACVGRGLAWGDFDNDGDADLVLTSNGGPVRILRNDAPSTHRSLRLRLVGKGKNRDALGALVTVKRGSITTRRERKGGGSYCSVSEATVLVGLGAAESADSVIVRWPGGEEQDLGGLAAGMWTVSKGEPAERVVD